MSDKFEFSIGEDTLQKMLIIKEKMGFGNKEWDEWMNHLMSSYENKVDDRPDIDKLIEKNHYKKNYEDWVKFFAINLNDIWNESSARELDPSTNTNYQFSDSSAIVIGAGPSVKKHNHLEILASSNYKGKIICTDRSLAPALHAGITPEKFPDFYVVTIDPAEKLKKFYSDEIIKEYGSKIKGIFTTLTHPETVGNARKAGIKIHWIHSLFDYDEGKKSFNQISALIVRAKSHTRGLPAIQTGGNVGTACWFIGWKILKCSTIGLIGINHGWEENDSWEDIFYHCDAPKNLDKNSIEFEKLFPKIYNPDFDCYAQLDPVFLYYSSALKEFIIRSPEWLTTINATEGGCIFGERIKSQKFKEFLNFYKN